MAEYPQVRDEFETVRQLIAGKSIGRLGDGELKQADGRDGGRQEGSPRLKAEMRELLESPHENCIVGIPTMDPRGPKIKNWERHRSRFLTVLSPNVTYYSSFITRPDSAPWIDTREFGELFQSVWAGKRTVIVAKKSGKVPALARLAASRTVHIGCPEREAYKEIDRLEESVTNASPDVVLLSCGPTATVLAHRLAKNGIQAIDIGSAGAFLCRVLTR